MNRLASGLFAALLSAIVVGAASVHFREQSPPPAAVAGRPAPLDRATLERRVDELLNAHIKVNRFSGAVLIASEGKPLVAKGYGYANVEWHIPNTTTTKFRIGSITKQFVRRARRSAQGLSSRGSADEGTKRRRLETRDCEQRQEFERPATTDMPPRDRSRVLTSSRVTQ